MEGHVQLGVSSPQRRVMGKTLDGQGCLRSGMRVALVRGDDRKGM